jgi:uncharacterized membrane protein YeiH
MVIIALLNKIGIWSVVGFTTIDLIAASMMAFKSTLLVRRPSHNRRWTMVGIVLLGALGGLVGSMLRDLLLTDVPDALTNPWYLIVCILAALVALRVTSEASHGVREKLFQFMSAFALPWMAAVGVSKSLDADLPVVAALLIGVICATAGRYFIDVTTDVPPKPFIQGEWFVGAALLASLTFVICDVLGLQIWPATLIAVALGFGFRITAIARQWEEPEPRLPGERSHGETPEDPLAEV